jgi:hypothetical protein
MNVPRNCFFASAENSSSMRSRSVSSAPAAFTASIPLMASIWWEAYFP